jgi:hypothetical protein
MAPVALVASKKGLLSRDSNLKIQENRGEEQKRVRIVGMSGSGGCSGDSLAWCTQRLFPPNVKYHLVAIAVSPEQKHHAEEGETKFRRLYTGLHRPGGEATAYAQVQVEKR